MILEKDEARFIEEDKVVDVVVEFIRSGEINYTNATYYLQKRLKELPAYIMPKLETSQKKRAEPTQIEKEISEGQDAIRRQISDGFFEIKKKIYGEP